MPLKELFGIFPKLAGTHIEITSPCDLDYNCVAWALETNELWYEPFGVILPSSTPPYYWPPELPNIGNDRRISTYVQLFRLFGYEVVDNDLFEPGFRKIAIYTHDGEFRHVARQTESGNWTSKIGKTEDIVHDLRALESEGPFAYGQANIFMRKSV